MPVATNNDAELVDGTLAGDREAFSRIVSRYQSLVCALTYSATGNLGQSEDLAQETFITAWKHLRQLRERDKLRAWLCGIARNRINNFLRREGRQPIRQAEPLENVAEAQSPEPLPVDRTIDKEEAEILWRSLEKIPEIYREPLVLFYREHQSIEMVAEQLELTVDTVKQRLSRGRKMLQDQVLAFVEGALARTNPGQTFTLSVLAALPAMGISAKAATLGAAAVKGSAAAKGAGLLGWLGALFTPLAIIFGNYTSYRMSLDEAQTEEERGHIKSVFRNSLLIALAITAALAAPLYWLCRNENSPAACWGSLFCAAAIAYFLAILVSVVTKLPARRRYLAGVLSRECGGNFPPAAYEYRSRMTLFGLPLVHVRIGDRFDVMRGPVKAWIAIGSSHAVGVIFASGGLAIAPISLGGISIGVVPLGAIALGILPMGAISLGAWAFGALAIGWQVAGGCGAAWNAAMGGIVFAHDFATGGIAHALQANTEAARHFIDQQFFFRFSRMLSNHGILLTLAWVVPMMWQARIVTLARRRREQGN
jgi:RNA polymerase sigma factor (sigma-70 family)